MELKSVTSNEISKPSVSENKSFDPDKRMDVNQKQDAKESSGFDVDKRIDQQEVGTTADERKEFASRGSDGEWTGEPGNSKLIPNSEIVKEKLNEYGQDGIEYKDGNPDFSKCSDITVEIDRMSSDRPSNFRKADVVCADKWNQEAKDNRTDWTAGEVREWRQANRFSWHERIDMKTMDLVQRDIHEGCKHYGGVAECKRYEAIANLGGKFDD